jgi:cytochrome c oxidase assembly protein subunit 15
VVATARLSICRFLHALAARWLAVPLALTVIGLGAWVRLSDAGLGCPDWPGCYGHWLGVPVTDAETAAAAAAWPDKPVDPGRAWKEMVHRYAAGALGLVILALFACAWRSSGRVRPPALEATLLAVVSAQALLGMWTVTELLKPLIVTAHLLGGMATLALLLALALSGRDRDPAPHRAADEGPPTLATTAGSGSPAAGRPHGAPLLRLAGVLALLAIVVQIALGGWVSANYAALACQGFPACNGQLWPAADWAAGFEFWRELGQTAAGHELPAGGLVAIHWAHRLGALLVALAVGHFAWRLWRRGRAAAGGLLLALLGGQLTLGIANVLLNLPLALAVAHNLGAALLFAATLSLHLRR